MSDNSEEIKWVMPDYEPSPYVELLRQMSKAINQAMMLPNWQTVSAKKAIGWFVDKPNVSFFISEFGQRIYTDVHTETNFLRPIPVFEWDFGIKPGYIRQIIDRKTHYFPVGAEWVYSPFYGKGAYCHKAEAVIAVDDTPKLLQIKLINEHSNEQN